jgi:hypothetical protein
MKSFNYLDYPRTLLRKYSEPRDRLVYYRQRLTSHSLDELLAAVKVVYTLLH